MSEDRTRSADGGAGRAGGGLMLAWTGLAAAGSALCGLLVGFRDRFEWSRALLEMPSLELTAGLLAAGALYLALPLLIVRTISGTPRVARDAFILMIAVGLAMRLAMLATNPAFEDDYYRYLWDGGVTANGLNPFSVPPDAAHDGRAGPAFQGLAASSGVIVERINHSGLKTIYPPVTQAAFALAHVLQPWSLAAWRIVCIAADAATLWLLLLLLAATGRPRLWAALYWWSPIAIKELANSAHMEAILMPLVLAAIVLAVRSRPVAASAMLAVAAGAKIWPLILVPLLMRPLLGQPSRLALAIGLVAMIVAASAIPVLIGGLDQSSGFVAYATYWQTNSALLPALERLASLAGSASGVDPGELGAGRAARAAAAAAAGGLALWLARRPVQGADDLLHRALLTVAALFMLSPAQFPWYAVWFLPFLALRPYWTLLMASVLVGIYYVSFHFYARDAYALFRDWIVWLIWLPVWMLAAAEARAERKGRPWRAGAWLG